MNNQNFVKLNRNIKYWRGYKNNNTFRVYVHLLLSAYWENDIGTTELTINEISTELKISDGMVRRAIEYLVKDGKITKEKHNKFTKFVIKNVANKLQTNDTQTTNSQHSNDKQPTTTRQQPDNNPSNKQQQHDEQTTNNQQEIRLIDEYNQTKKENESFENWQYRTGNW